MEFKKNSMNKKNKKKGINQEFIKKEMKLIGIKIKKKTRILKKKLISSKKRKRIIMKEKIRRNQEMLMVIIMKLKMRIIKNKKIQIIILEMEIKLKIKIKMKEMITIKQLMKKEKILIMIIRKEKEEKQDKAKRVKRVKRANRINELLTSFIIHLILYYMNKLRIAVKKQIEVNQDERPINTVVNLIKCAIKH